MSLQPFENKTLSWSIIGKSASILADITIRKSQTSTIRTPVEKKADTMTFPLHTRGERGYFPALSSDGIIRSVEVHNPRAFRAREVGQQGLEFVLHLLYNLV
jgi:hypothetical protein